MVCRMCLYRRVLCDDRKLFLLIKWGGFYEDDVTCSC